MNFAVLSRGVAVDAEQDLDAAVAAAARVERGTVEDRNDWTTLARAEEVAAQLTAATGRDWVAADNGAGCYPRYDVVRLPQVGDAVSKSYNGDSYPAGHVASVSESKRVIRTTTGATFWRRRQTSSWVLGGTWFLVGGHVSETNPHL